MKEIEDRKWRRKKLEYNLLSAMLSKGATAFDLLSKVNFTSECIEDVDLRLLFDAMKTYYDEGKRIAVNALPYPELVANLKELQIERDAVKPLAKSIWDMKVANEMETLFLSTGQYLHRDNSKVFLMLRNFLDEFEDVMYPKEKVYSMKEAEEQADNYQNDNAPIGIEPPIECIYEMLGNGELIIIGARPSVGKTAMMTSIITALCKKGKEQNMLVFSYEQTTLQIFNRIISNLASIPHSVIKRKMMSKGQKDKYNKYIKALSKKDNIYICDAEADSAPLEYVKAVARSKKREGKLDILFIDYVQLMVTRKRCNSRREEIGHISRSLKNLAKELKIPIIILGQLNRESEKSWSKKERELPKVSDLKESGALEQDADQIYLLDRDRNSDRMTVVHGKCRDGAIGETKVFNYYAHLVRVGEEE